MTESDQPVDFFDTSALIKHYAEEVGSDIIDRAFANPDTTRVITDITIIEFHSAFARRMRMGECDAEEFQGAKSELTADIAAGHLRIESLTELDKSEAARLIEQYGASQELRTLDAIQLAVMKRLGTDHIRTVYCADRALVAILAVEGFTVVNPDPPVT